MYVHISACLQHSLVNLSNQLSSVTVSSYCVLVFDRCHNRIDQRILLAELLGTLMAKDWVDGSGVNLITQYAQEAVASMKSIIMDDSVSGMLRQQKDAHGRVALQI